MKNLKIEVQEKAQKMANDLNLFGKRLRSKQLELCENLVSADDLKVEANDLLDWLLDNKPEKPKSARAISNKLAHDTVTGSDHGLNQLEVLHDQCYILTSAQNNTEVNAPFMQALENYSKYLNAKFLISGYTYNKTGFQLSRDNSPFFNKLVKPYMIDKPTKLFDGLVFAAELDIIPTATNPTTGHNEHFAPNSLIIPHAKIALLSLATPERQNARFIFSTGTVTKKNYRQQRAGQRAEQTHCISALIAVADPSTSQGWQVRQLHWQNDCFIDLDLKVTSTGIETAPPAKSISFGDVHSEKVDHHNLATAINLACQVKAENVFLHDLLDMSSRNHHNRLNHLFIAAQGQHKISDDLELAANVLNQICDLTVAKDVWIVRSNHDEALDRLITDRAYDFRSDPLNARLYLDLQSKAYEYIENGLKVPDMFDVALDVTGIDVSDKATFLTRQDQVILDGVLSSSHGDQGCNGARGSAASYAKAFGGGGATIGHSHSCCIVGNVYQSGCMNLFQGYNENGGLSSWSISHTVQYANGTRALIIF